MTVSLNAHNLAIACGFFAVRALLSLDSVFLSYQTDICNSGRTCPVGERGGLTCEPRLSIVVQRVLIRCAPNPAPFAGLVLSLDWGRLGKRGFGWSQWVAQLEGFNSTLVFMTYTDWDDLQPILDWDALS